MNHMTEKTSRICLISEFDNACSQVQVGTLDFNEMRRLPRDISQQSYADFKNLPAMAMLYDKFYNKQNDALERFGNYTEDLFRRAGKLEDTDLGLFLQTRINDILESNNVYNTQAAQNPDLELEYAKYEAVPSMRRSLDELKQLEIENPDLKDNNGTLKRILADKGIDNLEKAVDPIMKNRDAFQQRSYQQEASLGYSSPMNG
jgi:hypothetical protein